MQTTISVDAIFNCSQERAFQTPILGDATQFLVGYGPVPAVVKFTDDDTWGQVGGHRIPHSAKNIASPGGPVGWDEIYAREEYTYWCWGISEFYQWSMGFSAFRGELFFETIAENRVKVRWTYTLFSQPLLTYPLNWLFGQLLWKGQMKIGIQRMKAYAESDNPMLYD